MALTLRCAGPHFAVHGRSWKELYVEREIRSSSLLGAFKADLLHGHTAPARCVKILPGSNLVASGGYDRSVRLWDLDTGMLLAATAPLDDTVSGLGYAGSKCEYQKWLLLCTATVSSRRLKPEVV
jgi:WD40 repeat protein